MIPFEMSGLRELHKEMKIHHKLRDKFQIRLFNTDFSVIFLADRTPFELLVGIVGVNFAFIITVEKGYRATMTDSDFFKLRDIVKLAYIDGTFKFNSWVFVTELNKHIPKMCSSHEVEPHEISRYKSDVKDDKPFFVGWNDHIIDGRKAREENFLKTGKILGDQVEKFCRANNISSCWTDNPSLRNKYHPPKGLVL